jgi:hypothetical protein
VRRIKFAPEAPPQELRNYGIADSGILNPLIRQFLNPLIPQFPNPSIPQLSIGLPSFLVAKNKHLAYFPTLI